MAQIQGIPGEFEPQPWGEAILRSRELLLLRICRRPPDHEVRLPGLAKMRNAIPADRLGDAATPAKQGPSGPSGIASQPVAALGHKLANEVVPSTAGKLFFVDNGLNYVCSASTINNNYKNLIITAGHCVHSGAGGAWHSNIVFAPAYYNGQSGYGLWNWSQAHLQLLDRQQRLQPRPGVRHAAAAQRRQPDRRGRRKRTGLGQQHEPAGGLDLGLAGRAAVQR